MKTARQIERDARELWRFCLVDGTVDENRVRLVVDQGIESRRVGAPAVMKEFLRLLRLDRARRTARVDSAAPLAPDVRTDLEHELTRRYGPAIAMTFNIDPSLIGGVRLTVGSDVYDGSIKAGLAALEAQF